MFKSIEMINKDSKTTYMLISELTEQGNQNFTVTERVSPGKIFFLHINNYRDKFILP